jgi:hypothetical protein
MKISINYEIKKGPWGGGNRFVRELTNALIERGDQVVSDLKDNVDLILLIDPRWRNSSISYSFGEVARYIKFKNPNAIVVHRINECDERKNTKFINGQLGRSNYVADYTVFVASWLKQLDVWKNKTALNSGVILNGANQDIFNSIGHQPWTGTGPIKLVTHHWGANWYKGFDIYTKLDSMISQEPWNKKIEFTYVGNLPKGFKFKSATHIPALDGIDLAKELRKHHIYLTASVNEPGGNHQNEGALCGLPLLYRRSGCMQEYCDGYGEPFSEYTFEDSLYKIIANYFSLQSSMLNYPHTAKVMCAQYIRLFDDLTGKNKKIILAKRSSNSLLKFFAPQIPAIF